MFLLREKRNIQSVDSRAKKKILELKNNQNTQFPKNYRCKFQCLNVDECWALVVFEFAVESNLLIVGIYLSFSSACFRSRSLFLLLTFKLQQGWTFQAYFDGYVESTSTSWQDSLCNVWENWEPRCISSPLFKFSVVPLLIAPKNGEVQRLIYFVVKLILNSQKADWPSHKPLWFVILPVIKYHFVRKSFIADRSSVLNTWSTKIWAIPAYS